MVDLFALVVAQGQLMQHDHQQWIQTTIHYLQLKRNNRIFTGMATDSHILFTQHIFLQTHDSPNSSKLGF
jgi:hypothetical protein